LSYRILLPQFEGPFDLLLFFIERDELDIYDIPIANLANDFLAFLRQMEIKDMETAADFIAMAATLMKIKARMLLPRPELNEQGEPIDPRADLVERLLEYQRYKTAATTLAELENERLKHLPRGLAEEERNHVQALFGAKEEMESITLFSLLKAYRQVLARFENQQNTSHHTVEQYPFTLEGQRELVLQKAQTQVPIAFIHFFEWCQHKMELVFTLLAILDLVQTGLLRLTIGEGFNDFCLQAASKDLQPAA